MNGEFFLNEIKIMSHGRLVVSRLVHADLVRRSSTRREKIDVKTPSLFNLFEDTI